MPDDLHPRVEAFLDLVDLDAPEEVASLAVLAVAALAYVRHTTPLVVLGVLTTSWIEDNNWPEMKLRLDNLVDQRRREGGR
jgi:hypothetical protein